MNAQDAYHETLIAENRIPEPELELIIMQDAQHAYYYAKYVLKGRWSEAEQTIMQDSYYAYCYAVDIVKGRWSEAEPTIMHDGHYAYLYARDIIKGRWPEAEEIIAHNPERIALYAREYFNEPVVTKDEVSDLLWTQYHLPGYLAPARLFKASLLDIMVKE